MVTRTRLNITFVRTLLILCFCSIKFRNPYYLVAYNIYVIKLSVITQTMFVDWIKVYVEKYIYDVA